MTLNTLDSLNGAGGIDTLNVQLNTSVTPITLNNIELVNVTAVAGAGTLGLVNAGQVTQVTNYGSTAAVTVSGIAADADLVVSSVDTVGTTFGYASTTGTQSANLTLNNVTSAAGVTVAGIETINITSSGSVANSATLTAAATTTVNVAGTQDLTLAGAAVATLIDATGFEGNLTAGLTVAGTILGGLGDDALTGSTGNDLLRGGAGDDTLTSNTGNDSIDGGLGNDTIVVAGNLGTADQDTIDGGAGYNSLSSTAANFAAITTPLENVSNIQALNVTTSIAAGATINAANVDSSVDTVNLANVALGGTHLTDGAAEIVGNAGSLTVTMVAVDNSKTLGGTLTLTDTGSATDDSLTIVNDSTRTGASDIINNQSITSVGYENVTFNNGATAGLALQQINTLTITPDDLAANVSLTLTGANDTTITGSVTTTSTGLLTIDASGLTDLTGTAGYTFKLSGTNQGAGGTASIIGGAGNDFVSVGNFASTIVGGAGNDSLTGGTASDSILGGLGEDTITGGIGNDTLDGDAGNDVITTSSVTNVTIRGGEGDDTITATTLSTANIDGGAGNDVVNIGSSLNVTDSVNGGEGIDTLRMSTALIASSSNVSNFEVLQLDAAITQNMALFATNAGFTQVSATTGANTITNAGAALVTAAIDNTVDSLTLSRAAGVSGASLTVQALQDEDTAAAIVDNSDATINFAQGAIDLVGTALTISSLTATSAQSIGITGAQNTSITLAADGFGTATSTVTVDATAATGTVSVNGAAQSDTDVSMVLIGSLTAANTLRGGAGSDVITGGDAADLLVATDGNDVLAGGAGNNTLTGGAGNDTITAGDDNNTIATGTGANSVTVGDGDNGITGGALVDTIVAGDGANTIDGAASNDVITVGNGDNAVTGGTGADTITFGSGVNVAVYTALAETQEGSIVSGTTVLSSADIYSGLDAGDTIDVSAINTSLTTVATTLNSVSATDAVQKIGFYNTLTGIFTSDAAGTDTLIQFTDDTVHTAVETIVLVGYNGTATASGGDILLG